MRKKIYSVTLIGLGNIGFKYDIRYKSKKTSMSHASSINQHPNYNLLCGIDLKRKNRKEFENYYGLPTFRKFSDSILEHKPDIVIVSVNTESHKKIIKEIVSKYKPIYILIEKPMGSNLNDAKIIHNLCKKNKIKLSVNYPRVCDVKLRTIKEKYITKNKLITTGSVFYSKGILHNGSHFINLLEFYFGKVLKIKAFDKIRSLLKQDSNPFLQISFKNAEIVFIPVSGKETNFYSIELINKNNRIRFDHVGKAYVSQINNLNKKIKIETNQFNYQLEVYKEMYKDLTNKKSFICKAEDALRIHKHLNQLNKNG